MIPVDYYGLHYDGAIPWLVQGRGGTNFFGLKKTSPFVARNGMCNHLIPLAAPIPDRMHWEFFQEISSDPMITAMLPIPREPGDRAFYFEDPYDDLNLHLSCLSRLSSPIKSVMRPAWMIRSDQVEFEMSRTNVQPWILTQVTPKDQDLVTRITKSSAYLPRTVILTGKSEVVVTAPMKRVVTRIRDVDLKAMISQPLENIGATVLRRFARKEDPLGDLESRQDRRNRLKGS